MPTTTVLSLDAEFLDLPIEVAFQNGPDDSQLYVMKGIQDPENKKGVTLNELINKIGDTVTLGLTENTFKDALPGPIGEGIKFYVECVYVVAKKGKEEEKGNSNKYAFKVSMELEPGLTEKFIVEVRSLNFMIWTDTVSDEKLTELGIEPTKILLSEGNDA